MKAYCDPEGTIRHGLLPIYIEKDSFLSHTFWGQYVYCNPPWSLVVQRFEHLSTCNAKSSMNIKSLFVLPE